MFSQSNISWDPSYAALFPSGGGFSFRHSSFPSLRSEVQKNLHPPLTNYQELYPHLGDSAWFRLWFYRTGKEMCREMLRRIVLLSEHYKHYLTLLSCLAGNEAQGSDRNWMRVTGTWGLELQRQFLQPQWRWLFFMILVVTVFPLVPC